MTMVSKAHILSEIRRTAAANGGRPLGIQRFYAETGIKQTDWISKYWARWGDAIKEAGLTPNTLQVPYAKDHLLERLASFARELGRFPTSKEIALKARQEKGFPHQTTYQRHGGKAELASKLLSFCDTHPDYHDVSKFCMGVMSTASGKYDVEATASEESFGYVYLLKSGRFFKIGRTNAVGRRERELAIQLPERATAVHSIKTDDPAGIEDYWHRRFADRRKNGEWFELTAADLAAFKRRRFM